MGNEFGCEERVPLHGSGGFLQVIVEAGAGRGDDHRRDGVFGPPGVEHWLKFDQGIARAARAHEQDTERERVVMLGHENGIGNGRGEVV